VSCVRKNRENVYSLVSPDIFHEEQNGAGIKIDGGYPRYTRSKGNGKRTDAGKHVQDLFVTTDLSGNPLAFGRKTCREISAPQVNDKPESVFNDLCPCRGFTGEYLILPGPELPGDFACCINYGV